MFALRRIRRKTSISKSLTMFFIFNNNRSAFHGALFYVKNLEVKMENVLKISVGLGGGLASFLFGGWSVLLQVLVIFIVLDYIFGVLTAAHLGELSSKIGFRGIAKKVMILLLVAVAHSIDTVMGDTHLVRDAVIFFYIANELLSIIESAGRVGLPIPDALKKAVDNLQQKGEDSQ